MRHLLKAAMLGTILSGSMSMLPVMPAFAAPPATAPSNDAAFETLWQTEWKWRKALTGDNDDDSGEDSIRSHFPDVSKTAQDAKLAYWTHVLAQLNKIDPRTLSPDQQVNYTVYRNQIETLASRQKFRGYEMSFGFWSGLSYAARKPMRTEQDYRNYIAYLNDVPRYFGQNIDNLRAGLKRGFTPSQVSLQGP